MSTCETHLSTKNEFLFLHPNYNNLFNLPI